MSTIFEQSVEDWCPRPESNRHGVTSEGFSYHYDFRHQLIGCLWSGLSLHLTELISREGEPLSLYTFIAYTETRRLARDCHVLLTEVSPNLTPFTTDVAICVLNILC